MAEENTVQTGGTEESGKTFTQAEIDSIIEGRLARERQKYADYDSLKEKAGEYDKLQEANKTELQKATEKAEALQRELDQLKNATKLQSIYHTDLGGNGYLDNLMEQVKHLPIKSK